MAEDDGIRELTALVQRLRRLFDQQHATNQEVNARFERMAARWDAMTERWDAMAARWDGYIVELRQMNERLQAILERLPPPAAVPTEARRRHEPGRHRGSGARCRGEQGRLGATVLISTDLRWDATRGAFRPYLGTWEQSVFRV